jgi:diguanylate cyclase (GGDEF)-like protein
VALLLSSSLVVFDCLFRGIFFTFVNVSSDNLSDFLHSAYNLEVHVSTITVCLFFPFSAIAAMTARAVSQHRDAALVDPLTGLSNRRGLDRKIAELSAKAPGSLAVVVCDIDHFKRINDTYGHATGDEVIVGVAKLLAAGRRTDWEIARVGGEEFILLLPGADETLASDAADEIRVRIRDFDWRATGILNPVTASFGIAHVRDSLRYEDVLDAIKQADKALYRAKEAGRDRVVAAGTATVPEHAHPVLVCA